MSRAVFLCLALFVGSVSAWHNWFSKNKQTECGRYKSKRWGWFFSESMTDVDTRKILSDIKAFDTNNDGFITFAELTDPNTYSTVYPGQNLLSGVSRCQYVQDFTKRFSWSRDVANTIFDLVDIDHNLQLDGNDRDPVFFQRGDPDGDGRIPICDSFRSFMQLIDLAESQVYLRDLRYTNLVNKYRKPWFHWFQW